jgi:hypothetical protein
VPHLLGEMKKWLNTFYELPIRSGCVELWAQKIQKAIGDGLNFLHVVEEMVARCELAKTELMAMIALKI